MKPIRNLPIALALFMLANGASAQERPFLFTVTAPAAPSRAVIFYDAAIGQGTFEPFGGDRVEQLVGVQAPLTSRLALLARTSVAVNGNVTRVAQQAELLTSVLRARSNGLDLAVGGGVLHEYSGTNALLARVSAGRTFSRSQLYGNLLLEKALASDRDEMDVMTTLGWSHKVAPMLRAGIEAVGQDLEGFWSSTEAEGGAKLYAGPAISFAPPESRWQLTVGAGPILRAGANPRMSGALRDLPSSVNSGFVLRTSLSFGT
jgi:hypothetical protein